VVLDVPDRQPEQLVPRVSQAFAGLPIHEEEPPGDVVDEDRVGGVVAQEPEALLAVAQRLLGVVAARGLFLKPGGDTFDRFLHGGGVRFLRPENLPRRGPFPVVLR
jgi:hypothetical protein